MTPRPSSLQADVAGEDERAARQAGTASAAQTSSGTASRSPDLPRYRRHRRRADEPVSLSKREKAFKARMKAIRDKVKYCMGTACSAYQEDLCCLVQMRDMSKAIGAQWVIAAVVDLPATARHGSKLQALVYGTPNMKGLLMDEAGEGVNTRTLHAFTGDLLGSEPKQL